MEPIILPYSIETDNIINVNDIRNVPIWATKDKYICYSETNDGMWYFTSSSNLNTLRAALIYGKKVMENPIYGMSDEQVRMRMGDCIRGMGDEYLKSYLDKAYKLYNQAIALEQEGKEFFIPSSEIKAVIDKYKEYCNLPPKKTQNQAQQRRDDVERC